MTPQIAHAIADAMSWRLSWAELQQAALISGKPFYHPVYQHSEQVGKAYFGGEHICYTPHTGHDLLHMFALVLEQVRTHKVGVHIPLPMVSMLVLPGAPDAPQLVAMYKRKRTALLRNGHAEPHHLRIGSLVPTPCAEDDAGRSRVIDLR